VRPEVHALNRGGSEHRSPGGLTSVFSSDKKSQARFSRQIRRPSQIGTRLRSS
jgi:hypothetical protein